MSELIYRIDPLSKGSVRIFIEEKGAFQKRALYPSTLKQLAKQSDVIPLQTLIQAKRKASLGTALDTLSCQQIDLAPLAAIELFPDLLKTNRFYIGKERIEQIANAEMMWNGEALESDACRLELFFFASQKIHFQDVTWSLSTPNKLVALKESTLYLAPYSGLIKWIEKAKLGPFALQGTERRRFLEEDFLISWKKKEEVPLVVHPVLSLHDPNGTFADLQMDYGKHGLISFQDPSPLIGSQKRLFEDEKQWEKDLIEAGYLRKQVGRSPYYCPGEKASEALSLLFDIGWKVLDLEGRVSRRFCEWDCEIQEEGGSIVLKVNPLLKKALFALKKGGAWISASEEASLWIDRKEAQLRFGELIQEDWEKEAVRLPKNRLSLCLGLAKEKKALWQKELYEAVEKLGSSKLIECEEASPAFQGELLPYQKKGLGWLLFIHRFCFGGLLADEMGLGKTVQLLAFFSRLGTNLPILIVAPTSLLYHWRSEFSRFLPKEPVLIHSGASRAKTVLEMQKHSFILTSYAVLRQDVEMLSQMEFETVVLDESNAIKNKDTQAARAACRLKGRSRFCLSGTPIENRPSEYASQFAFLMPDLLSVQDSFDGMRQKSAPFLLRRKKGDVQLDLPDRVDSIVWVDMEEEQKALYEEYQKSSLQRLQPLVQEDGAAKHRMEILEAILRLRQIALDPNLIGKEAESAKLNLLEQDLGDLLGQGSKALIYSQFTSMLDRMEARFQTLGYPFLRIDGSMSSEKRAQAVEQFQQSKEPLFMLLSLKAGGVGLNLTAADYVLLFDPWWNEAVEQQAIARAHRIGRAHTVFIKRYLTPNTIEEKMLKMKESKQLAADQILDGGAFTEVLSADEWLSLLSQSPSLQ